MQAVIDAGVIGDFRAPDIMRFGFTPLYVSYVNVWDAVERLVKIMETDAWDKPEFKQIGTVTQNKYNKYLICDMLFANLNILMGEHHV